MPSLTTYKLLKQEHDARRGEFKTVHGTVQTPAFQNVATAGAIKGGLSAQDLKDIGAQVMLCNTYHLHLRPGDKLVADIGRPAQVYPLERAYPDRQRRISGVQPGKAAQDHRGGRDLRLPSGRAPHLYGARGEHADSGKSGLYHRHGL